MSKEQFIFEAAAGFDFDTICAYVEKGNNLNICNDRGRSLLTCFIDGYYAHEDTDPEELALYDLHDACDYDFWDSYVFKIQRITLGVRSSGILKKLDYLFDHGADPKEPLNNSSAAGQRIFSPIRAVQKTGNTYSIPPFSEPSAGEKSLAASSCRIIQSFPNLCVIVDGETETALMHAVCRHDYYLCKYLLEHGADPGVRLFTKPDYETRDREYWLMDELDISIMNGDKGEAAAVTLRVAQLLWEYGLREWSGYCIDVDQKIGVTGGHPMRVLF